MKKNYIIATAGHVDHGKTSIIKALTGKDCDTHLEEKQRGITIHLGFSHLQLSESVQAGIIDVPGHKDFIDTMISGINEIDLVLFIVAADEGFMPQTLEHMHILETLRVKKGIILLTKCDLVDSETLSLAYQEIKEHTKNTFLSKSQIIPTSTYKNYNIDKIKQEILKTLTIRKIAQFSSKSNTPKLKTNNFLKKNHKYFRMYPDRFFQLKGFGSVVTGTVISGTYKINDKLFCSPGNNEVKVRKLESYGNQTDKLFQGQRASLNLPNFEKNDFFKGIMFSEIPYNPTSLIDVELKLYNNVSPLQLWSTVEFYCRTIQTQARVHLLNKDKLFENENCFAQLHLDKAIPICYNDNFIIRNSSGDITLGGGRVLDAYPLHHRRRTEKVKSNLRLRASNSINDLISSEINKNTKPISLENISRKLFQKNININDIRLSEPYLMIDSWFWLKPEKEKIETKIIKFLQIAHKNNPLDANGKEISELQSIIKDFPESSKSIILRRILDDLRKNKIIDKRQNTYALCSHEVNLETNDHIQINWVDQFILNQRMKTLLWSEITERGARRGISEKRLKQILFYLVAKKRLIHHDNDFIHSFNVEPVRIKVLEYLNEHTEGLTVGQFRDLINGNRKICLILLNIFDSEGIIIRTNELRFITDKGKQLIFEIHQNR